jgi:hypothetical protein
MELLPLWLYQLYADFDIPCLLASRMVASFHSICCRLTTRQLLDQAEQRITHSRKYLFSPKYQRENYIENRRNKAECEYKPSLE